MSESNTGPQPEILTPDVKAYLEYATAKLLICGVSDFLKQEYQLSKRVIVDMYQDDEEAKEWHLAQVNAFHAAELPFALRVFEPENDSEFFKKGEKYYEVTKVDQRGHVFQAYDYVDLFILDPDGKLNANELEQDEEVNQAFVETVIELAEIQKSLGWEPIFDYDDLPK